jgi:trk system potassium uptake protein
MRVLIVGAGAVGFHLASRLAQESQEVVLVDPDAEKIQHATDNLDVLAMQGNGASVPVLEEAGVRRANLLIAVSGVDEVNLMACRIADQAGVRVKVARVRNPEHYAPGALLTRRDLGVDLLISPEQECAWEIYHLLASEAATDLARFADGVVQFLGLRIQPGAPMVGRTFGELGPLLGGNRFSLVALLRNEETRIPEGETVLEAGDKVFLLGPSDEMHRLPPLAGHPALSLKRVMIAGGSGEAEYLARHLRDHGVACTIFERDPVRSRQLAEALPKALVLKADPTDLELLQMEGVEGADGFVALTQRDELNLLIALLAKSSGARRVIPLLHRTEYMDLAERVGLDAAVSPRISAANSILRYIRRGAVASVATVKGSSGEALEAVLGAGSRLVGERIQDLRFPRGAILGTIVRRGKVIKPQGMDLLLEGDHLVFFALPDAVSRLGALLE